MLHHSQPADRPWPTSPAPRLTGNAVKSDKWHAWCHLLFATNGVCAQNTRGTLWAVWFTATERVTQQLADLMCSGMDAFLTPSTALWVSDCLLSYFHLFPSSTLLFFCVFLRERGDKALANLCFLAGWTGWSKCTPTYTGAHTNTRLSTLCQISFFFLKRRKNSHVDRNVFDQTADPCRGGLCRSPVSWTNDNWCLYWRH